MFAFGPFVLVPERKELAEDGAPVRIGGRAFDILTALLQRPGELVSKHELLAYAWPGVLVEEANLKVTIGALRRVLHDDSEEPRYIATVVGRGYRFIAPVRTSGLASPAPAASSPTTGNLPVAQTRIFGRAETITALVQELERSRLVSIVGPGGMGKTTVAVAVAHEAARAYADGAWFVDLSHVNPDSCVQDVVALAVGVATEDVTAGYWRNRQSLLVLDNCEHVIDAVARYADQLLANSKYVKLLTTSRESLCIRGERVRRLTGLSDAAAMELFVDRAKRRCPAFALDAANTNTIREICSKMDGLALAIENVALRIDTIEVGKMLEYLDSPTYMFDGEEGRPARHHTMAATIDWSYQLLSDTEKAVLERLAIFNGAFSLESACEVGARVGVDSSTVVKAVASLASKSLLVATARDGEMDYRQTGAVRAFVLLKGGNHG